MAGTAIWRHFSSCWKVHPPALTSLTAHSPGDTPCMSPLGPMHREAATGFCVAFNTSTAHTASSTCSKYCNRVTATVKRRRTWKQVGRERFYLSNQEVHVLLHKHIQLSLEDVLHFFLTLTTQVRWRLRHSSSNQSIAFVGNLPGQIAGGLVDLSSLQNHPDYRWTSASKTYKEVHSNSQCWWLCCLCSPACHRWRRRWRSAWRWLLPSETPCAAVALQIKQTASWRTTLTQLSVNREEVKRKKFLLACFRVFTCSFRGPGTSLHVASLLQRKHKPSIADHNLSCAETLQNSLLKMEEWLLSATSTGAAAYVHKTERFNPTLGIKQAQSAVLWVALASWKGHVCLRFADPRLCFPNSLSKFNFLCQFRLFQVQMRQYVINWQNIQQQIMCLHLFHL